MRKWRLAWKCSIETMSKSELNFDSYPPVFRPPSNQTQSVVDTAGAVKSGEDWEDPIPVIDLHCQNHEQLGEACRDWGLFRVVNHGVPPTLLSQLHEHAKKLFNLSFEFKQDLFTRPLAYFWGTTALTRAGAALSLGPQNINWVEGFHVPLGQLSQSQSEDPTLASFRLLLDEYGKHLARLATTIFKSMATNLNLGPGQANSGLSESTGIVRVYRYPLNFIANSAWGLDVHTDSSVLSILNQYEVGGLEVLKDNEWLQVKPISNTLIVNLGDMMQALSDDKYKSVKHRVNLNKQSERISICYFVFPGEGSVIQSSKYKPFTYADFQAKVQEDVKTLGFKVGLERFRLTEAS